MSKPTQRFIVVKEIKEEDFDDFLQDYLSAYKKKKVSPEPNPDMEIETTTLTSNGGRCSPNTRGRTMKIQNSSNK